MERINVAELLKDCPIGMELNCLMYEDVYFEYVDELNIIHCYIQREGYKTSVTFNQYGTPNSDVKSKCVIFPKGKTTWDGFQIPWKDGDILTDDSCIFIIQKLGDNNTGAKTYCVLHNDGDFEDGSILHFDIDSTRLATEDEKKKLFQAIKDNGYHWNDKTKTLEKLIEPKFEVGNRVKEKKDYISGVVTDIFDDGFKVTYKGGGCSFVQFHYQDNWELVSDKFDISTLKPYDRVLVRDGNDDEWVNTFFGFYDTMKAKKYPFTAGCLDWAQCIPYEGNEHLLSKTDDCDDFYKTWEA